MQMHEAPRGVLRPMPVLMRRCNRCTNKCTPLHNATFRWLLPYCFTFRNFTITFTLAYSHLRYPSAYPFTQQAMHQPQHAWIIAAAKRPSVVFV